MFDLLALTAVRPKPPSAYCTAKVHYAAHTGHWLEIPLNSHFQLLGKCALKIQSRLRGLFLRGPLGATIWHASLLLGKH